MIGFMDEFEPVSLHASEATVALGDLILFIQREIQNSPYCEGPLKRVLTATEMAFDATLTPEGY